MMAKPPALRPDSGNASESGGGRSADGNSAVYPTTHAQDFLLSSIHSPEATLTYRKTWVIAQALRVRPGVDSKRAERAFNRLVHRHEALRMRFGRDGGGWIALVDDRHSTGLQVHDSGSEAEDELAARANALVDAEVDIQNGPLFEMHLLKCARGSDVLVVRLHHLVCDAWSIVVIAEEFFRLLMGLPLGGPAPVSYAEYLRHYETALSAGETHAGYWQGLLLPAVPRPNIGRLAKGFEPNLTSANLAPTEQISTVISANGKSRLARAGTRAGTTANAFLIAAFADTLAVRSGADELYIRSSVANRAAPELRNFVGFLVHALPIRCNVSAAVTLDVLAQSVHRQVQQGFDNLNPAVTTRNSELDCLIKEQGGHTAQFMCGSLLPEAILRNSVMGPGFMAGANETVKAGSVSVERLQLPNARLTFAELDLRSRARTDGLELMLSYDLLGFTQDEAMEILTETLKLLGLKRGEFEEIRYNGRFGAREELDELEATGSLKNVHRVDR